VALKRKNLLFLTITSANWAIALKTASPIYFRISDCINCGVGILPAQTSKTSPKGIAIHIMRIPA
jgi:hypothetical protein